MFSLQEEFERLFQGSVGYGGAQAGTGIGGVGGAGVVTIGRRAITTGNNNATETVDPDGTKVRTWSVDGVQYVVRELTNGTRMETTLVGDTQVIVSTRPDGSVSVDTLVQSEDQNHL